MYTSKTFKASSRCIMLLCFLCSISCNKDTQRFKESPDYDENQKNTMILMKEINHYTLSDMQCYSPSTQRQIFRALTPANKCRLMRERLDFAIEREQDEIVRRDLKTLREKITPRLYEEHPDEKAIAIIETFVENMIPRAGYNKMREIGTTWGNAEIAALPTPGTTPLPDCGCSRRSTWWCGNLGSCAGECTEHPGCGFFFMYKCNGNCTLL